MIKELIIYSSLISFFVAGIFLKEEVKSFKDYALGSKPYTKLALSATVIATMYGGGSTIGAVSMVCEIGLIYIITQLCTPISILLQSVFIVPRYREYVRRA